MEDVVGHAGYIILALGQWLISKKRMVGWACRCAGDVTWFVLGIMLSMSSIVVWSSIFFALDVNGWRKWLRRATAEPSPCYAPSAGLPS